MAPAPLQRKSSAPSRASRSRVTPSSHDVVAMRVPSGEKRAMASVAWPPRTKSWRPVRASHTRAVASSAQVSTCSPAASCSARLSVAAWPRSTRSALALGVHTRTLPSAEAVTTSSSLGPKRVSSTSPA
jgi:hypothetical protein